MGEAWEGRSEAGVMVVGMVVVEGIEQGDGVDVIEALDCRWICTGGNDEYIQSPPNL